MSKRPLRPGRAVHSLVVAVVFALCGASASLAQESAPQSSREKVEAVARRIMSAARFCSLVTIGGDGAAQARIVDPTEPDASLTIYVATNPGSRKVAEIKKDPRVTLLYFDTVRLAYVTVIGRASEVSGSEKGGHYKKEWDGFFARDNPDTYTLYRIIPSRIEVVSAQDGLAGDTATWRPEILELKPR
ncbi:MAG: pyridoxamine 5'-phosphate oxidase family protein [Vicinamibacteria bacterium]|nr:pyridoxamine 5'-phosphate oxidase family protein [Vicinamibacteria bacterium]